MALQLQTFKTRTLTAIVFVIAMVCGLFINHWLFLLLFCVIHFGCWFEFQKLIEKIEPEYKNISSIYKTGIQLAGWGVILWFTNDAYAIGDLKLSEIGWYIILLSIVTLPIVVILFCRNFSFKILLISLIGLLCISLSCGCMIDLRSEGIQFKNFFGIDLGLVLPVLVIATIWINDTMAYIVGSLIGKTKLSDISPKKTWEGTLGGIFLAVLIITLCGYYFLHADIMQLIIISTIACIAGVFGDLLESKLKRMAHVKDSGSIMPGHGGFLDRFDSLLQATTFVWLYIKLFL